MEHKSLYLVEELPTHAIAGSLIKQISANDTTYGRRLYRESKKVEMNGKLIINTNNCPNLAGSDRAVWDRMILIPWDVRYANEGEPVDEKKWVLPSDPNKMDELVKMKSAFVTVCLNELHKFYTTTGNNTQIPVPQLIKDLVLQKREEAFPIIAFIKKYLVETKVPENYCDANKAFYAYSCFMRRRRKKSYDNIDQFMEMLTKCNLEVQFNEDIMEHFIKKRALTDDGEKLVLAEIGDSVYKPEFAVNSASVAQSLQQQADEAKNAAHREEFNKKRKLMETRSRSDYGDY